MPLNQPSFPLTIEVILGPAWEGLNGLSEDDVVTLTRYSLDSTLARYSEDGTSSADTSTNRIRLSMRAASGMSTSNTMTPSIAYQHTTKTSQIYFSQLFFQGGSTNGQLNSYIDSSSLTTYTFLDVWNVNNQYTDSITTGVDGMPNVFKSMAASGNFFEADLDGTGTVSASAIMTYAGMGTLGGSGTVDALGGIIHPGMATISGSGSMSPLGGLLHTADSDLSGTGTINAVPSLIIQGEATTSGSGTVDATASIIRNGVATTSGSGTMSADASLILAGEATLSSSGTMSAGASLILGGDATMSGSGTASANAIIEVAGQGTLSGSGSITVVANITKGGKVDLVGTGTTTINASMIFGAKATLPGAGAILAETEQAMATLRGTGLLRATLSSAPDTVCLKFNVPCNDAFCDEDPPLLKAQDPFGIECSSMCFKDRTGWRFKEGDTRSSAWVAAVTVCTERLWLEDQIDSGQPVIGIPSSQR